MDAILFSTNLQQVFLSELLLIIIFIFLLTFLFVTFLLIATFLLIVTSLPYFIPLQ